LFHEVAIYFICPALAQANAYQHRKSGGASIWRKEAVRSTLAARRPQPYIEAVPAYAQSITGAHRTTHRRPLMTIKPSINRPRCALLAIAALSFSLAFSPASAQEGRDWTADNWVGTWGSAPAGPPLDSATQVFNNQTLRLIVHSSIGGNRVRIRLSNEMGGTALRIGGAHVALRAAGGGTGAGADIIAASDRALSFSGGAGIVMPPGAAVLSDPVDLAVPALSDLAVSLYLPGEARAGTIHGTALQTNYVSLAGNFVGAATFPTDRTITQWPFLTEVDVSSNGAAIVTLGNSITDGTRSTVDSNNRWPDWLAQRLQISRDTGINSRLGVVNRGISGNRLLSNPPPGSLAGRNTQERFDRDVLATAGARYLTVLIGINDIGNSTLDAPVTAADLIAGYRQLIARAHAKGIYIYGGTLTPFQGAGYYSPDKDVVRQAVNNWIRGSDEFDAVIDFDRVLRDPANPLQFNPAFDSGDHLHPNDLGYQAMANAVPLELFRGIGLKPLRTTPAAQNAAAASTVE
jgi:lysophospholipase L1-like esterase